MKNTILLLLLCLSFSAYANEEREKTALKKSYFYGLEYRIKAGFNIGGTSPLPLPAEIRELKSYRPGMQIAIEGNGWMNRKNGALCWVSVWKAKE